jgi:LysR family glycine cleavage system transcriptional activator
LREGRLVRLSPIAIRHAEAQPYHLVYPAALRDWPPLASFRRWLYDEMDESLKAVRAQTAAHAPHAAKRVSRAQRPRRPPKAEAPSSRR